MVKHGELCAAASRSLRPSLPHLQPRDSPPPRPCSRPDQSLCSQASRADSLESRFHSSEGSHVFSPARARLSPVLVVCLPLERVCVSQNVAFGRSFAVRMICAQEVRSIQGQEAWGELRLGVGALQKTGTPAFDYATAAVRCIDTVGYLSQQHEKETIYDTHYSSD